MTKMMRTQKLFSGAAAMAIALTMLATGPAQAADDYPSRPIHLVVPVAAGGAPDVLARSIGEKLGTLMGQPIVIINRPGANGNIGMETTRNARPDGYTLVIAHDALLTINPHLYTKTSVGRLKDFTPIAMVAASTSFLFVVPASLPVKTFPEFIEYAKKANPPLAYASGGSGSLHHLGMEMLKSRAGIDMIHIPYKGGAPEVTAVISGDVSAGITSSVTQTFVRAGRLRALAVTGSKRLPSLPDVPAIAEFYPGFDVASWFGIFGPPGMPDAVVAKLRKDIAAVLQMPEVKQRFQVAGDFVPFVLPTSAFIDRINTDYDRFGKVVKQIGLQID
jgi:tripartite-type tricarboxylate transporter receptor subunit TctC